MNWNSKSFMRQDSIFTGKSNEKLKNYLDYCKSPDAYYEQQNMVKEYENSDDSLVSDTSMEDYFPDDQSRDKSGQDKDQDT